MIWNRYSQWLQWGISLSLTCFPLFRFLQDDVGNVRYDLQRKDDHEDFFLVAGQDVFDKRVARSDENYDEIEKL